MWHRKYHHGSFQHFHSHVDIACYQDSGGWRFRFSKSVPCDKGEFYGYAASIHFWKTLKAIKFHIEKTIDNNGVFAMTVKDVDGREHYEGFILEGGKFVLV
jgi:hypothetical protein